MAPDNRRLWAALAALTLLNVGMYLDTRSRLAIYTSPQAHHRRLLEADPLAGGGRRLLQTTLPGWPMYWDTDKGRIEFQAPVTIKPNQAAMQAAGFTGTFDVNDIVLSVHKGDLESTYVHTHGNPIDTQGGQLLTEGGQILTQGGQIQTQGGGVMTGGGAIMTSGGSLTTGALTVDGPLTVDGAAALKGVTAFSAPVTVDISGYLAGTSPAGEVDALTVKAIAPEAGQTRSGSGIVVAANGQGGDANLAIQTTGGDSDLDGDLLVGSALFADGPASLGSVSTQALSAATAAVSGPASFNGPATFNAGATLKGGLTTQGAVSVDGNLAVTGTTTLGSGSAVTPVALTARGGVNVQGHLQGTSATFKANVLVQGNLEVLRYVIGRYYFWWRPKPQRHYPFTAPAGVAAVPNATR